MPPNNTRTAFARLYDGILAALLTVTLIVTSVPAAFAFISIRDAETEHLLRVVGDPIFKAAGLDPEIVKVHIEASPAVNAFATGNQDIIFTTGIIDKMPDVDMLTAVMAHETGHVAGRHVARTQDALDKISTPVLLATLLGIGAVAVGAPTAGGVLLSAGTAVGQRSLLKYSRTQESAADQAAVTYLDRTGQSSRGFEGLFKLLDRQDGLNQDRSDVYTRTHPISRDRISILENRIEKSPYADKETPPALQHTYDMVRAKLRGYTNKPEITYRQYPEDDQSSPALYARAFAYYKEALTDKSIQAVDELIAREPDNPWFYETKGQILFESGRLNEALEAYQKSVDLQPQEPLLEYSLGQVMLATEDERLTRPAIAYLEQSIEGDPDFGPAYYQLAFGYGRDGQIGKAELATAERYIRQGDVSAAIHHATRAQKKLPEGSPQWIRASDIIEEGKELDKKR